jgi:hypothetical protein
MRTAGIIAALGAVLTLLSVGVVSAASGSRESAGIVADVDGHSIKPVLIGTLYCHDFDYPRIHCFRSQRELDAAAASVIAARRQLSSSLSAADYVLIYDGATHSGASMYVSQNYDALFTIGWNDRVSSYQGLNSASGTFWTDWFSSGTARNFCCNASVLSLPSNLDNAFSSVYRH